jgi:hypothetical protein
MSFDAGPIVATIFVERMGLDLTHEKPALSGRKPKPDVDAKRESRFDGRRLQSNRESRVWPTRSRVSPIGGAEAPGYLQK